ncbi:MAG: hypothetical protein IKP24_03670 [Alphaproteobacteria bacterium]|nr:hypothetical protein [Alphaproteobacteria bacterium]
MSFANAGGGSFEILRATGVFVITQTPAYSNSSQLPRHPSFIKKGTMWCSATLEKKLPAFFNIFIKKAGILIKVHPLSLRYSEITEFKVQIMQKITGVFDKNIQKHREIINNFIYYTLNKK